MWQIPSQQFDDKDLAILIAQERRRSPHPALLKRLKQIPTTPQPATPTTPQPTHLRWHLPNFQGTFSYAACACLFVICLGVLSHPSFPTPAPTLPNKQLLSPPTTSSTQHKNPNPHTKQASLSPHQLLTERDENPDAGVPSQEIEFLN